MDIKLWIVAVLYIPGFVSTVKIYVCDEPSLADPDIVPVGGVPRAAEGHITQVKCKGRYEDGTSDITCKNGQWTPPDPQCKLIQCPYPADAREMMDIQMACRDFNCTALYSCLTGYWYDGTPTIRCQRNKTWTDQIGICKAVVCPKLPDPNNGKVLQLDRSYNKTASTQCDEGFIASETHTARRCQDNNTWDGNDIFCNPVLCPKLPEPEHGNIHQLHRSYKDSATTVCDEGYVAGDIEAISRYCRGDNTWGGKAVTCEKIVCPTIPNVENGILSGNTGSFKDRIILQCNSGYTLDGVSSVNCTAFGNWSALVGKCRLKDDSSNHGKLILGLTIPAVLGIIIALTCALYVWHRRKENQGKGNVSPENPLEMQRLLNDSVGKFESHFTFFLTEDLGNAYPDEFEYKSFISTIQEAIVKRASEINITITTTILYLCQSKRRGFLTIYTDGTVNQDDLITVMSTANIAVTTGEDKHTYSIPSTSIKAVDKVQSARSAEILRDKHVKDMSVDETIDFDTQYVKLRIHTRPTVGIMQREDIERPDYYQDNLANQGGTEIEDEDLIKEEDSKKYVLLRGRAGIGKSTLMQRLLWKWANGEWATQLRVMILLNLRYLMTIKKPMDLLYMLNVHSAYNSGRSDFTMDRKWLEENEMSIGFVLDGVDEVRNFSYLWMSAKLQDMSEPIQWCFALMRRELLQNSTIIVSSRPFADLGYIGKTLQDKSLSKHLKLVELMGLTRERVEEFVNKNVQEGSRDFVWQTLVKNPILMSVSSITFYCAALCKILGEWTDAPAKLKTYTQITAYIIDRFIQRSLQKVESPFKVEEILQVLSKLAFNGLVREIGKGPLRLVFDAKDIAELSIEKNVTNIMIKTGILMQTEIPDPQDKENCTVLSQFVHLMIQEFLGMAGLLAQGPKEFKRLLKELCKTQQFGMARLFLYGLAFNTDNEILKKLNISIVSEDSNREELKILAKNMPDKLQAVQVAHESQSADVACIVGLHNFKDGCRIENTKLTVIDILALTFVLEHNPSIHNIRLERTELDRTSVKEISKFLKSPNKIEELALIDDTLDDGCVEELMLAVKDCERLEDLEVSSDSMTDIGLSSVASAMMTSKTVVKLNLSSSAVTDTGVKTLARALKLSTTLRSLRILFRGMTNEGVQLLAASLKANKTLEEFWLIDSGITDDGLEELTQALRINTSIKNLRIDCRIMTDDGIAKIADSLSENRSLAEIWLHSQHITDEGVKYFMSRLKDRGNLADIVLSGFYMTEDAITAILDTMTAVPALSIGM